MFNPILAALRGKGVMKTLVRSSSLIRRYGFTAAQMDTALAQLTGILRDFDCSATLPVTAAALARHPVLANRLQDQGNELAVHGFTHVDHSQLTLEAQRDHLRRARAIFERAGVKTTGFRCPYLRGNAETLAALAEAGFAYDSSPGLWWDLPGVNKTDAYRHVLDFYGAKPAADYPALPSLSDNLVRIPYCLPDDEALVERLGLTDSREMSEIWLSLLERVYAAGELFTLGLHPERVPLCAEALRALLSKARSLSPAVWIAHLDEIAVWYRALGEARLLTQPRAEGSLHLSIQAPSGSVVLARAVAVQAPMTAWAQDYQQVLSRDFGIPGGARPWIGLPPERPVDLERFLRHLGYLVEISPDPLAFTYYFNRKAFLPEDQRPLLESLENGQKPLLRLGRWPQGAQAALAVTGDIDAFTLWDYLLRMVNR